MSQPTVIKGGNHQDARGQIGFNNDFDASEVKRLYTITNNDLKFVRAWQGHKIERRWFSAVRGSFRIKLVEIDHWENPSKNLQQHSFLLLEEKMDVLSVPAGFVSSIQALESDSKLLVMADYMMGQVKDEYRFESEYFSEEQ